MENLSPWLLLIAGLLVGALLGGIGILVMERRNRGSAQDIRAARQELEEYRQDVAEHYVETAKRVNALTHSYKSVYDHLEDGAYRLVGEEELRRRLDDRGGESVMLEGIGQRSLQRPGEVSGYDATYAATRPDDREPDGTVTAATDVLPSTGTAAGHAGTAAGHVATYPTVDDSVTDDVADERSTTSPATATVAPAPDDDEQPRGDHAVEAEPDTADGASAAGVAAVADVPEGDDAGGERVGADAEDEVRSV